MLLEQMLQSADRRGNRAALCDPFRSLSYGQLRALSAAMARQIGQLTHRPHVGIMLPASAAFAGTFYGSLWAGKTPVPLNFLLKGEELAGIVQNAELDCIISVEYFRSLLAPLEVRKVFLDRLGLRSKVLLEHLRRGPRVPSVDPEQVAVILYTSGTWGEPKGVCLTHRNLAHNAQACIAHARMSPDQRFLGVLPLFHSFGLTTMMLCPISLGATAYYLPRFQPAQVVQTIGGQSISIFLGIASMFGALLRVKQACAKDFASLKLAISGGEPLARTVYDGFLDRFECPIQEGYGLTETSPVVSINMPWCHRPGTVGKLLPQLQACCVDADDTPLPADEPGEVWIRGPSVMQGYFRQPEQTAEVLTSDGWLRTGDMGQLDEDGFLQITGRKKEMIIVGGMNVYPAGIEQVLQEHPCVSEAAVIAVADGSRGEVPVAFVILNQGDHCDGQSLREFCRQRMAGYKVPRQVHLAAELPRGPTGKILKRALHEQIAAPNWVAEPAE